MGKIIKSEKKGGGEESKFIEEYTPLKWMGIIYSMASICNNQNTQPFGNITSLKY
jgi:hypothetical protein